MIRIFKFRKAKPWKREGLESDENEDRRSVGIAAPMGGYGAGPNVIRLYQGAASGSENWTHQEREAVSPTARLPLVTNRGTTERQQNLPSDQWIERVRRFG